MEMKRNLELQKRQQWWRRKGRKQRGEEKESCWNFLEKEREDLAFYKNYFSFLFHFLFKSNSTCPLLIGAKRAHLFL